MTDSGSPGLSWFDARVGERMVDALALVNERGPYESMTAVSRDIYGDGPNRYTNTPVLRCLDRGLLTQDRNHDARGPKSSGAILITDDGRRVLALHGRLDAGGSGE